MQFSTFRKIADDSSPVCEGFLYKRSEYRKRWKLRWVVLHENKYLLYYKDNHRKKLKGSIYFGATEMLKPVPKETYGKLNSFEIVTKTGACVLAAEDRKSMECWLRAFETVIGPCSRLQPRMQGYLYQRMHPKKDVWLRRYFVVSGTCLFYFNGNEAFEDFYLAFYFTERAFKVAYRKHVLGWFNLEDVQTSVIGVDGSRDCVFTILNCVNNTKVILSADKPTLLREWLDALDCELVYEPRRGSHSSQGSARSRRSTRSRHRSVSSLHSVHAASQIRHLPPARRRHRSVEVKRSPRTTVHDDLDEDYTAEELENESYCSGFGRPIHAKQDPARRPEAADVPPKARGAESRTAQGDSEVVLSPRAFNVQNYAEEEQDPSELGSVVEAPIQGLPPIAEDERGRRESFEDQRRPSVTVSETLSLKSNGNSIPFEERLIYNAQQMEQIRTADQTSRRYDMDETDDISFSGVDTATMTYNNQRANQLELAEHLELANFWEGLQTLLCSTTSLERKEQRLQCFYDLHKIIRMLQQKGGKSDKYRKLTLSMTSNFYQRVLRHEGALDVLNSIGYVQMSDCLKFQGMLNKKQWEFVTQTVQEARMQVDCLFDLYRMVDEGSEWDVEESIQRCRESGVDINFQACDGSSPIHNAVLQGNMKSIQCLLNAGALVDVLNPLTGETPLHVAVENGHTAILELLLDLNDTNFNIKNNDGKTAFHRCVEKNDMEMVVQFCANRRVDVNTKDKLGSTPLHSAARMGSGMLTRILLESGADIHATDNSGLLAADVAKTEAIARIIEEDVDSDYSDDPSLMTKSFSRYGRDTTDEQFNHSRPYMEKIDESTSIFDDKKPPKPRGVSEPQLRRRNSVDISDDPVDVSGQVVEASFYPYRRDTIMTDDTTETVPLEHAYHQIFQQTVAEENRVETPSVSSFQGPSPKQAMAYKSFQETILGSPVR